MLSTFILSLCLFFSPPVPDSPKGTLVIAGGNISSQAIYSEFIRLAEEKRVGPHIVIITTASSPANKAPNLNPWPKRLHISSIYGVEPFPKDTDAVWIEGGDQCLLEDAYIGTSFEKILLDFYKKGGIIAGSSAGAAFMSRVMIRGGTVDNLEMGVGLDLLPHCIIDQHFSQRGRLGRLEKAVKLHPGIFGVGIDENTAVVYNRRVFRVVGKNEVTILRNGKVEKLKNGDIIENLYSCK